MTRRPAAVIALALVLGMALTACTDAPVPQETAAATPTPTPTPTAAPDVLVVAAGDEPPALFGGECATAVDADMIAASTGIDDAVIARRDVSWTRSVNNLGGLTCEWQSADASGRVTVIPQHALGGAELPPESQRYYFEQCDWSCAWVWESDELWISGWETDLEEKGREEADRRGSIFGPSIAARLSQGDLDWRRDTDGWLPRQDCSDLAAAIGASLGATLVGADVGYPDPAGPATEIADVAAGRTWCSLSVGTDEVAMVILHSGLAWDVPWAQRGGLLDLGIPGITAYDVGEDYFSDTNVEMSDGTNSIHVAVFENARWDSAQIATAVAEFAQSGQN